MQAGGQAAASAAPGVGPLAYPREKGKKRDP
jgi:hypothetical protein